MSMFTIAQAFDLAVQHHRAGRAPQAEQFYRHVLLVEPQHVGALHLLGLLAHQVGRSDLAIDYISQALRLQPDLAEAQQPGNGACKARKADGSGCLLPAVAALKPEFAKAHNNLANAFRQQGKLAEAVASYQEALRLAPDLAETQTNLGVALLEQGKTTQAIAAFQQALASSQTMPKRTAIWEWRQSKRN